MASVEKIPMLAEGYDKLTAQGTKVRVEQRTGEGTNRAATVFQRLLSAGKRLLRVIEHNEGGANKDLAKFADQINALCDKWDR